MKKEKALTKSPIEDKPLRYPTQSLDESTFKIQMLFNVMQKGLVQFIEL